MSHMKQVEKESGNELYYKLQKCVDISQEDELSSNVEVLENLLLKISSCPSHAYEWRKKMVDSYHPSSGSINWHRKQLKKPWAPDFAFAKKATRMQYWITYIASLLQYKKEQKISKICFVCETVLNKNRIDKCMCDVCFDRYIKENYVPFPKDCVKRDWS